MTQTATRERWSRQEDEGRGERVRRLEVGDGEVGGKAWAVARVLITTSRSKQRRPGVGLVALDGEAVRSAAQRVARRGGRGEWALRWSVMSIGYRR